MYTCKCNYNAIISLKKKGSGQAYMRPVLLYGSETWPVKEEDRIPSKDLLTKFNLLPVRRIVQRNQLHWFSHVVRMDNDNWVKKSMMLKVYGRRDPGRPKKT